MTSVLQTYIKAWATLFKLSRVTFLWYSILFVITLFIAYPLWSYIQNEIGSSLAIHALENGFDYTFFSELMHQYGNILPVVVSLMGLFVFVFLGVSTYLTGGIIGSLQYQKTSFSWSPFWTNCRRFFWRLFRLGIYFSLIQLLLLGFFFFIFLKFNNNFNPVELESELSILRTGSIILPIYLLAAALFRLVHNYAKIVIVKQNNWLITRNIIHAFSFVFRYLPFVVLLGLLILCTFLVTYFVYYLVSSFLDGQTLFATIGLFIFGQLFTILRISLRILNLISTQHLYTFLSR